MFRILSYSSRHFPWSNQWSRSRIAYFNSSHYNPIGDICVWVAYAFLSLTSDTTLMGIVGHNGPRSAETSGVRSRSRREESPSGISSHCRQYCSIQSGDSFVAPETRSLLRVSCTFYRIQQMGSQKQSLRLCAVLRHEESWTRNLNDK